MRVLNIRVVAFLLAASASVTAAFSTLGRPQTHAFSPSMKKGSSSALYLFGGGGGGGGDAAKKGPGFMDQLAMLKKAQEIAQKRGKLDEELKKMSFVGESANGKVKATFKYVPATNPMDPNPDYEAIKFDFDDEFFASATPEELSAAIKECIVNGIDSTNKAVAEKYSVLQGDLAEALGSLKPKQ
ncbi:hypothetical protein ACA910_012741 [Epithemia clementina (nom. ined.)]